MFMAGVCWSLYGWLVIHDVRVYLPNMLGVLLAALQLALFAVYGIATPSAKLLDHERTLPFSVLKLED